MVFGKKRIGAQEIGRNIYDGLIRMPLRDPPNELSYESIMFETLKIGRSEPLPKSHIVEVIAGILLGALIVVREQFPSGDTGKKILEGIFEEMNSHLRELGFGGDEINALIRQCIDRMAEYYKMFRKGQDSSTMFILGERFYWNILGREDRSAKLLEIAPLASLKMVFAQHCVRKFLDQFKVT